MRRFRFRLERVLAVRRTEARIARAAWAAAVRDAAAAESDVEAHARDLETAQAEQAAAQAERRLLPARILAGQRALERLRGRLARAERRRDELRAAAEARRADWIERDARAQALERLRERELGAHRTEAEARTAAEVDERATVRAVARRAGELPGSGTDGAPTAPA